MYLKTARWGINALADGRLDGYAFRLHLVGVLAALRASQHALLKADRDLPTIIAGS